MKRRLTFLLIATMLTLVVTVVSPAAFAVDGVLEINQTCAANSGCFSGDLPGFPVAITEPGSYRLTSNLTGGISSALEVSDVTIDLNGFTLTGAADSNGIQITNGDNWEIRNGTVRGFINGIQQSSASNGHRVIGVRVLGNTRLGIQISGDGSHRVEGCTVIGNGADGDREGISIAGKSTVIGNTVSDNFGFGMSLGAGTGYGENVIANNGGGTVVGGVQLGINVCDGSTTCP
jgi:parallel beta-helix repeat protein